MKLRLSFVPKLTLIFMAFAAGLLATVGLLTYFNSRAALQSATTSELVSTAIEKQAALNAWLTERLSDINALSQNSQLVEEVNALVSAEPGSSTAVEIHDRLADRLVAYLNVVGNYTGLMILHPQTGEVLVSTDPTEEGKFRESMPFFIEGKSEPYIQNLYFSTSLQAPAMTASAPFLAAKVPGTPSDKGRLLAVLAANLDLNDMNAIIQRRTGLHATDDAFLVSKSYLFVSQPRFVPDPAVLQLGIHTTAVERCLAENSGSLAADDYRGVPALIVYRWLPERQLCLIVKLNQAEVFTPVINLGNTIGLVALVSFLLAGFLAYMLARGISYPIYQLVQGTDAITAGNLEHRIQVRSGDEFGVLSNQFNSMATALQTNEAQLRAWGAELEQRVAERTLELGQSEARYRTLAETSPEMIFVIDREDRVQYINQRAAFLFKKAPEEVIGHPHTELFPPRVSESQKASLHHVLETGEALSSESKVAFPSGEIWLETQLVPLRDKAGQVNAVMGISHDITERKQADLILRARLRILEYSESHDVQEILVKTLDEVGELINSPIGFYHFVGSDQQTLSLQAWSTRTLEEYCKTEGNETHYPIDKAGVWVECVRERQAVIHNDYYSLPHRKGLPEGHASLTRELVIPIFRKNLIVAILGMGNKPGDYTQQDVEWGTFFADLAWMIVERKQNEHNLEKANHDLARSNSELERFAYVASHDLQEPLRMVTSYLQLLVRRYRDRLDGDALEFINYAVDGSNRMKALINDLLAYSRVGTRGNEFKPTDCEMVLGRVLQTLQLAEADAHVEITHDPLPVIKADETQIEQLLQNLVGNAIKFHGAEAPYVHIGTRRDGQNWIFSVRDNGIGIDPQFFERIFIIFQRLHNREEYEGTGIGLAISKRIIERHGGRIWIESEPGQGSTFYFTIPIQGDNL